MLQNYIINNAVLDYSKESMKFTNKIRIKTKLDYKDNI